MTENCFILFACCIPVRGAKNSIICDLQRGNFKFIPSELCDILEKFSRSSINEVKSKYPFEDHEIIDEYFEFLEQNEFGFWTNTPELFPELDTSFAVPGQITNSIIDFDADSNHDTKSIFRQLEFLGCQDIQLRFYYPVVFDFIRTICDDLAESRIKSIELLLMHNQDDQDRYKDLVFSYSRITSIILHSGDEDSIISKGYQGIGRILKTAKKLESESHCGDISPLHFSINFETFFEAKNYNSCLNKKISIDKYGNIKNCPSMSQSYGKISATSLVDVVKNSMFRKYWGIKKELVDDCKVCEFRFICTDCRAYLKDESNQFSKPLKCSYDPYKGEWLSSP